MNNREAKLLKVFEDYGRALGEFENAASAAYDLGAELNGRMVNSAMKGMPIDVADLLSEVEMCRDAGMRVLEKKKALWKAWDDIKRAIGVGE